MKPRVLLDVDGVLADFAQATLDIIFQQTGRRYPPEQIRTWEIFDSLPETKEVQDSVYDALKSPGGCYGIPLYPEAKEGVAELRKIADVTVVTSPFFGAETWVHEREKWLIEHFGFHHGDFIHARKKHLVHGDFLIDDKLEHVVDWMDYWQRNAIKQSYGLYWSTPRDNAHTLMRPYTRRVKSWPAVIQAVRELF